MRGEHDLEAESPEPRRSVVGGEGRCTHPTESREYLGNMGTTALYRCTDCGGAIATW